VIDPSRKEGLAQPSAIGKLARYASTLSAAYYWIDAASSCSSLWLALDCHGSDAAYFRGCKFLDSLETQAARYERN
jgi:hypothetical protein